MADSNARLAYERFLNEWADTSPTVRAHSSGSTGTPKEIMLPKSDMWRSAQSTVRTLGLDSGSVIASALPMRSIATKMAVVRSLAAACRYLPIEPSNNLTPECRIDLLSVGPSQTDCLIANPHSSALIGILLVGGAPHSQEREQALLEAGYDVYETYGMTETCSNVALRHCPGRHFKANCGISFGTDSRSCLTVDAPGYSFSGLVTNDIIDLISPTEFIWRGRHDNVINSGGIKIHPEEVEKSISSLLHVPYYIIGVPDPKWGTAVALVVEGSESDATRASEAMRDFPDSVCRPRHVFAVPHFDRTPTGKIRRTVPDLRK